jgi:hypothetical protein
MDEPTGEPKPGPKTSATPKNKAQVEFGQFKARVGPVPAWAFPPSLAAMPPTPGGAGAVPTPGMMAGSLGERLNTTLGLGLELLNAGLAGGIRLLSGLSGVASGLGAGAWPDPYAHHGACGCGHADHATCDCCCVMGAHGDCQPSVGTCG